MSKKPTQEDRLRVLDYFYIDRTAPNEWTVPNGFIEKIQGFHDQSLGLAQMLQGVARFVADQEIRIAQERRNFWNKLADDLGLERGTQFTINHGKRRLRAEVDAPEKPGKLIAETSKP